MAHLFGIRPWEWDGGERSLLGYGVTLGLVAAVDKHRAEMKKAAQ